MHLKAVLGTAVLSGLLCANLSAAPITQFSTVNLSGIVTVSVTGATQNILWFSDVAPNLSQMTTTSGGTGDFVGTAGQNFIGNLNSAAQPASTPVSGGFVPKTFLDFTATKASLPQLIITFLFDGVNGAAGCAAPPVVPQFCTPTLPAPGSPFNFENTPTGSTVSLDMSGVTSDGSATWMGIFTAQFNVPYQTILSNFAAGGSVTNTFSATITATPIPEAGTMSLLGLGLIGVSMRLRRRKI